MTYELVCSACSVTWIYERGKPGSTPLRCPPCTQVHKARLRARYRTTHTANAKRWRQANPEKMAAARDRWERANPETRRQYRRARKKADPISNRAYVRARRARKLQTTVVPITAEQLRQRMAYFGGLCWMCGSDERITLDHVKPLSKGGAHMVCNLRPACHDCNTRKGARWPFPTSRSSFPGWEAIRTARLPGSGTIAA